MQIYININDAEVAAMDLLKQDAEKFTQNSFRTNVRSRLNSYRNGTTVKDSSEATHSIVRVDKKGNRKTVFYKGGQAEKAGEAYDSVCKLMKLPMSRAEFINNSLAEVDAIIANLETGAPEDDAAEQEDAA
jgi:sugar/nucleoside kinase (ribokinase family)